MQYQRCPRSRGLIAALSDGRALCLWESLLQEFGSTPVCYTVVDGLYSLLSVFLYTEYSVVSEVARIDEDCVNTGIEKCATNDPCRNASHRSSLSRLQSSRQALLRTLYLRQHPRSPLIFFSCQGLNRSGNCRVSGTTPVLHYSKCAKFRNTGVLSC
jgi:hypothetical protein